MVFIVFMYMYVSVSLCLFILWLVSNFIYSFFFVKMEIVSEFHLQAGYR